MDLRALDDIGVTVTGIEAHRIRLPLVRPYENSLGRLDAFDVIVIAMVDKFDRVGWGEACPVAGYSPETPAEAWDYAELVLPSLVGRTRDEIARTTDRDLVAYPFVVSALHEALDDLTRAPLLYSEGKGTSVELLGTVNTLDLELAPHSARELLDSGYRTLKVKVGYEPVADAARVAAIADAVAGRAKLRIDANQGYTLEQALEFARRTPRDAVEVFEQPVPAHRWDLIEEIGRIGVLPLMLDESIYGLADIERAASIEGVTAVKLKMSKAGGPSALEKQVALCNERGLDVVIGNGVATDLGCYHEALCYEGLGLAAAAEMNGFLKTRRGLLTAPLTVEAGKLIVPDPNTVGVDAGRVRELAEKSVSFV